MRLKKAIIHDAYEADVGMLKGYVYIAMPSYCQRARQSTSLMYFLPAGEAAHM